ncbi:helix-turn-helix domain-containing protein [Fulvimarina sp. MAC3]|uniref:TetR/AcrR family transcriptional regulator n=1 Tax=Fulvimarina sp. MAC3 TaxID=3148887 RepID=UPI0031FE303D
MMPAEGKAPRRPRADALRNREALLEAAKAVLAEEHGAPVNLEAIAKRAGVGVATLYRNFPTREALYEAVYTREVDAMGVLARELRDDPAIDGVAALRRWAAAMIALTATKRGMITALAVSAPKTSEISRRMSVRVLEPLQGLIERAVNEGRLRESVTAADLLYSIVGIAMVRDHEGWQEDAGRMIDALIDGLSRT